MLFSVSWQEENLNDISVKEDMSCHIHIAKEEGPQVGRQKFVGGDAWGSFEEFYFSSE